MMHRPHLKVIALDLDGDMPVFMGHYQTCLHRHSRLYPGVEQTLQTLFLVGYRLAVVTNKPYRFTYPLLEAFGLSRFSRWCSAATLGCHEAGSLAFVAPDARVAAATGRACDSGGLGNDIMAAKAAGTGSIGLTYGYNYGEDIGLCGPDAVCEQFNDMLTGIFPQAVMEQ
jgi:phosphoglycolate phosphatase